MLCIGEGFLEIAVILYTDYTEKNGFPHGKSVYGSARSVRQIRVQNVFNHGNS